MTEYRVGRVDKCARLKIWSRRSTPVRIRHPVFIIPLLVAGLLSKIVMIIFNFINRNTQMEV